MIPENELIERCKNGDYSAFEQLVLEHQKKVYNIAFRIVGNIEDSMDITQEVFIRVYKSISGFSGESKISTWIYKITSNLCLDFLRKHKNLGTNISIDGAYKDENSDLKLQIEDKALKPDEKVETLLMQDAVRNAINELEISHKTIIILRDINGFSYNEIAEILDCSVGTVKSRISRARKNLKKILNEWNFFNSRTSKIIKGGEPQ